MRNKNSCRNSCGQQNYYYYLNFIWNKKNIHHQRQRNFISGFLMCILWNENQKSFNLSSLEFWHRIEKKRIYSKLNKNHHQNTGNIFFCLFQFEPTKCNQFCFGYYLPLPNKLLLLLISVEKSQKKLGKKYRAKMIDHHLSFCMNRKKNTIFLSFPNTKTKKE